MNEKVQNIYDKVCPELELIIKYLANNIQSSVFHCHWRRHDTIVGAHFTFSTAWRWTTLRSKYTLNYRSSLTCSQGGGTSSALTMHERLRAHWDWPFVSVVKLKSSLSEATGAASQPALYIILSNSSCSTALIPQRWPRCSLASRPSSLRPLPTSWRTGFRPAQWARRRACISIMYELDCSRRWTYNADEPTPVLCRRKRGSR